MPRPGRKRTRSEAAGGAKESGDDDSHGADAAMQQDDAEESGDGRRQTQWGLPPGYDDRNRAFLQAFMAHGALTLKQAQPVLAGILNAGRKGGASRDREAGEGNANDDNEDDDETQDNRERTRNGRRARAGDGNGNGDDEGDNLPLRPDEVSQADLDEFVDKARQALAPLDFDIRSAVDQVRGERLWALVSTDPDDKAHLAVLLTPRKLAFVHRLLAAVFDTYNTPRLEALCVTAQQAIKLSRPPRAAAGRASEAPGGGGSGSGSNNAAAAAAANRDKGLKHSVVLVLLQSLVRQGWFDKSAAGFYTPTTRALLELEPFLVAAYQDADAGPDAWQRIKYCAACRDMITTGQRCTRATCTLRLHDRCAAAFWRTQAGAAGGGPRTCPRCATAWVHSADGPPSTEAQGYVGERAITLTDVYKRKKRQGRPSEGVDELVRAMLPRTVAAAVMPMRLGNSQTEEEEEEEVEDGDE